MRDINTPWFDVALVSTIFAIGNILFGHFEERTPHSKRLMKYIILLIVIVTVSHYFGRTIIWIWLGIMAILVGYVHGILLPKKGINGRTGEPKDKYYEFRGWDKDIFKKKK